MKFFHPNEALYMADASNYGGAALATLVEVAASAAGPRCCQSAFTCAFRREKRKFEKKREKPARAFARYALILAELARLDSRVWVATRADIAASIFARSPGTSPALSRRTARSTSRSGECGSFALLAKLGIHRRSSLRRDGSGQGSSGFTPQI